MLVLPYSPWTFDDHRTPHSFAHLLADFRNSTRERHMSDLDETIASWNVRKDALKGDTMAEKRAYLRKRFYERGDNFMHWHSFTPGLVTEMAQCLGMAVVQAPVVFKPIHMMVVLRKGRGT